jgi:hypothetical protein
MRALLLVALLFAVVWYASGFHTQSAIPVPLPEPGGPSNMSNNWSGYVSDTDRSYSAVGASWKVPKANADASLASDAAWVGIGGSQSRDLIQAGTQAKVEYGEAEYQAWYETLPHEQRMLPVAIHPGDDVSVSLAEKSPSMWHLSFSNNTTGQKYAADISYDSSHSSAEWIVEAPATAAGRGLAIVPLDNFGSVDFHDAYAIADGKRLSVSAANARPVTMADEFTALATPSALASDGASFSVARTDTTSESDTDVPADSDRYGYRHTHHVRVFRFGGGRAVIYVIDPREVP